ncbi:MAG: ABC transporter substrate-binding protein [Bacillota bacterium]
MIKVNRLVLLLVLLMVMAACEQKPVAYQPIHVSTDDSEWLVEDDKLIIWTTIDLFEGAMDYFFEYETDLELELQVIDPAEVVDRYYEALTYRRPPDLFFVSDEYVGLFSEIDGFVDFNDLITERSIYKDLPSPLIDRYINLEKERYAVPISYFPYVTYYRHDLLESKGFPSEPEALGAYIETEANYHKMARTFFDEGTYIFESNQALLQLGLRTSYPFDADYTYRFDTGAFKQVTDTVSLFYEADIRPEVSIWSSYGQNLLRQDELIMFHMPTYGVSHLKDWVPEQAGKWRMTSLPLGLSGIDREGSIVALMSEKSHHQRTAFKLLQIMTRDQNYLVLNESSHPMLDQENLTAYYTDYVNETTAGRPSMLDLYARRHWYNTMFDINKGVEVTNLLFNKTHDRLQEESRLDQRILIEQFVSEVRQRIGETD